MIRDDIARVLISEEQIQRRISELAAQITEDYRDKEPILVCILKGAVLFYSDLTRRIDTHISMDFMSVSSYGDGTVSSGKLTIRQDLSKSVEGRHVIIVEDIVDSGRTLSLLKAHLAEKQAASVRICSLLDKPSRRLEGLDLPLDYKGFQVENEFVVGYGLDYAERYRNLPYVGVLKSEVYEN